MKLQAEAEGQDEVAAHLRLDVNQEGDPVARLREELLQSLPGDLLVEGEMLAGVKLSHQPDEEVCV
jgi:hypothetical protein